MIIQLIGFLAFVFLFISYFVKNKDNILLFQFISYIIFSFHYLLLGAFTGAAMEIGCAGSSILSFEKVKNKKLYTIIFIILYLIIGIFTYDAIYSIIPIISNIIMVYALFYGDEFKVRLAGVINSIGWMLYSFFVHSYSTFICNIILLIYIILCMFIRRKNEK